MAKKLRVSFIAQDVVVFNMGLYKTLFTKKCEGNHIKLNKKLLKNNNKKELVQKQSLQDVVDSLFKDKK